MSTQGDAAEPPDAPSDAQGGPLGALRRALGLLGKYPWSLGIAFGLIVFFAPHPDWHGDLKVFREAAESLRHPYYARWIFALLGALPEAAAYVLLEGACTALLYFAVRAWGGKHWMMFLSFPFAWTLFYGQIDGLVVGGLALAWWAMEKEKPLLVGAGLILASIKPQMALPLGIAIWWWSRPRWKALVVPALALAASFVEWGFWIPVWFQNLFQTDDLVLLSRNISLWTLVGPWIWLIWIPILLVLMSRLPRPRKLVAIAAGTMLSAPYFPLSSGVLFLGMAVPWWSWAAVQLPAVLGAFGWFWIYDLMKLVPPALLVWAAWPELAAVLGKVRLRPKLVR